MEAPTKIQSPLMTGVDPVIRKERSERNKRRINDFILEEMSIGSASLSPSTSSLSLSTPNSPKIMVTESEGDTPDSLVRLTRINTNSKEKLIYKPYGEDLLNENKMPFTDVNFCFHCDKDGIPQITSHRTRTNTVTETPTQSSWTPTVAPTSKPRRPRSTSSIGTVGRDHLRMSIEKTGSRMVKGLFVTVYRQVFLCSECQETIQKEKALNPDFVVKISPRARTYFQ